MKRTLSLTTKLTLLIVVALVFAATMIGLSMRNHPFVGDETGVFAPDQRIERTFEVQSDGRLMLNVDAGDVIISGTESTEVKITVTARGSKEKLKKYEFVFDQEGNTIRVEGRLKRKFFDFFSNYSTDIVFSLQVPSRFNADIRTSGGDITVRSVTGHIEGRTSGGDLHLERLDGSVRLSTSGGDISASNCTGEVSMTTSGGDIHCESLAGSLQLGTSGGDISILRSEGRLRASTSGGDIRAELKDNQGIYLSTSGGDLHVKLPESVTAEVQARTSGGDVRCDFQFAGKIKEGRMEGTINGGGELIRLTTSGGDIVISSIE